jgi:GT2 family glycosyltransferase
MSQRPGERRLHPSVTAVVLTHDRRDEVLRTIACLAAVPEQPNILVVDNGSSDGTASHIASQYPDVTLIRLERNIGAAARNIGLRRASTPYVALCDDDTWWSAGSLQRAAAVLDAHRSVALVTAKVLVGPEQIEDSTCRLMEASPLPRASELPGPAILGFLAGASLVRRTALLDAGGFEPKFFLGGEEALLTYDLAEAGWTLLYLSSAVVHHFPSPSRHVADRRRNLLRNALWVAWMRRPIRYAWKETRRALRLAIGDPILARGFVEALVGMSWVLRRRRVLSPRVESQLQLLEVQAHSCPASRPGSLLAAGVSPLPEPHLHNRLSR